jgi:predicted alpha/beta-fold hydrolase
MPLIDSSYKAPFLFKNRHLQTIYASFGRKAPEVIYRRERIQTPDGDFLDLDWAGGKKRKLAILSHGMEGSSGSKYILCMIPNLIKEGFECLAWNFRGCSGSDNMKASFYHSGISEDLKLVVDYALSKNVYDEINLIGFSMGGNISLKYAGEQGSSIPEEIKKVVVFAVPCDLKSAVNMLAKKRNYFYMQRFLNLLKSKIEHKARRFPELVSLKGYNKIKNFIEFDKRYTAPLHGFSSAEEYWRKCSSLQFIPNIKVPTLLLNAKDDSFLGAGCYPYKEAEESEFFFMEATEKGGHVGFIDFAKKGVYWSEKRAVEFFIDDQPPRVLNDFGLVNVGNSRN